ncbi:MAG: hypothetical protein AB1486_08270 [Planctomycetota bacterium]
MALHRIAGPRLLWIALFALAGCGLASTKQEVLIRHVVPDDRLDLLLVHYGVTTTDSTSQTLEQAVTTVGRVLRAERVFPAPLAAIDLDQGLPPISEAQREALGCVRVTEAGAFRDSEGRLGLYQVVRIERLGFVMKIVNEAIATSMLAVPSDREWTDFDTRSFELWQKKAREGSPWATFRDGSLYVEVPLSRALKDKLVAALVAELRNDRDKTFYMNLLTQTGNLSYANETLSWRFDGDEHGTMRLAIEGKVLHTTRLSDLLAEKGLIPDEVSTLDAVLAKLEKPTR